MSDQELKALEEDFHAAWTGAGSTPFLADIRPSQSQLDLAVQAVKHVRLKTLFDRYPTLAIWAVLYPLSLHYGEGTSDVYRHISEFVLEDFSDAHSREDLKEQFRYAARKLGLPVAGNDPSALFFSPLGPARSQHLELAKAFVITALRSGPPAVEDTTAARRWQRLAVNERCPNHPRLRQTIHYDASAFAARQFEAWRKGEAPNGESEAHLFSALDEASGIYGIRRTSLVAAPKVIWSGDLLGLQADRSNGAQFVHLGVVPSRLSGGQRVTVPAPWPESIAWRSANFHEEIPLAPTSSEALVFDADTGQLIGRVRLGQTDLEVAAERLIVLSGTVFSSPSFGDSIPARDDRYSVAWVLANEVLSFEGGSTLSLKSPSESAIWLDGVVIGREGSRALYGSDGALVLKINTDVGGASRVIRATIGNEVRFFNAELRATENFRVDFSAFGLASASDPVEVRFDVLAPGAAGDPSARAELSTRAWIWPGCRGQDGELSDVPTPSNFDASRSAGLLVHGRLLSVNHRSDIETPILGLRGDLGIHEFHLAARSEKLWQYRIQNGDKVFVPRGATVVLGHENRHDTLMLRSPDREASLIVFGEETHRPFRQRSTIEIPASVLQRDADDDRIALRRSDGRVDLLAHVRRVDDPGPLTFHEDDKSLTMTIAPRAAVDAIRVNIESISGDVVEGDYSFGRNPSELPPVRGVDVRVEHETGKLRVTIERSAIASTSRLLFFIRSVIGGLTPLSDARNIRIAVGLAGSVPPSSLAEVTALARLLAEPETEALWGQMSRALSPAYYVGMSRVGVSRMIGSVKPILNVTRSNSEPPLHDLVGVAPWIFEAPPSAYTGLSEASGLYPLNHLQTMTAPLSLPTIDADEPLALWLDRVGTDLDLPKDFGVEALQHAFRCLRYRLRATDLQSLISRDNIGRGSKLILNTHVDALNKMRSFDIAGGGDEAPARIAIQVERFARACAQGKAENFVTDLVFRTGLSHQEVGRAMTMMVRAAIEFFVYFRALWSFAALKASR